MRGIQHVDQIILGTETVSCVIRQYADYSMLWYTNFMERIINWDSDSRSANQGTPSFWNRRFCYLWSWHSVVK